MALQTSKAQLAMREMVEDPTKGFNLHQFSSELSKSSKQSTPHSHGEHNTNDSPNQCWILDGILGQQKDFREIIQKA